MTIRKDGRAIRDLQTLFRVGITRDLTDGQLLERFAADQSEAAEQDFSTLIERHGPMVLRVCNSVLADPHDAQDAFQATFLVLVKRGRGLWVRDSVGPWLYQVAYRTAICARRTAARRRRLERGVAIPIDSSRSEAADDLGPVLHEELNRLPARFQAPIVLCDLEGLTHELAARHLGWPVGTVKSRLARGRERLRGRLIRRGINPNAGLMAVTLRPDALTSLMSPSLLDGTTKAAIQFASLRTIAVGSVTTLVQEVLRNMLLTSGLKIAAVAVALGATGSGVSFIGNRAGPGIAVPEGVLIAQNTAKKGDGQTPKSPPADQDDGKTYTVKPGKFSPAVVERGRVEAARSHSLVNQVEGQTTIIAIVPEGTQVKKGDLICELDSAPMRDQFTNQKIVTQEKDTALQSAKLNRELAEISVTEYLEGTYKVERNALDREVILARGALQQAEEQLRRDRLAQERIKEILDKLPKSDLRPADIMAGLEIEDRLGAAESSRLADQFALHVADAKKNTLEKYTKSKTLKKLTGLVEKARAVEIAAKYSVELQKSKEGRLERRIKACKLYAPSDGTVVYASGPGGMVTIDEGVTVRERQPVCSIIDLDGPMQVNTSIPEPLVGRIRNGQKVRIAIDAFEDQVWTGEVRVIFPLSESNAGRHRTYKTQIKLDQTSRSLRPGMTAEVEIVTDELDNVLSIPKQALMNAGGFGDSVRRVTVKKLDGQLEWRKVTVGRSNAQRVEIKEGLHEGDVILLDPRNSGLQ